MSEKAGDVEEVSGKLFNDLYESQYELLRRLKFIAKAGRLKGGESTALELIDDYLRQKESALQGYRKAPPPDHNGRKTAQSAGLERLDSLYDQYADFCRKLRFLVMGALAMEEQLLALEMISEFLELKEKDLQGLKAAAGDRVDSEVEGSLEQLLGRLLMEREDYRVLQRIAQIKQNGGTQWELLQSLIREQAAEIASPRRPPGFKDDAGRIPKGGNQAQGAEK